MKLFRNAGKHEGRGVDRLGCIQRRLHAAAQAKQKNSEQEQMKGGHEVMVAAQMRKKVQAERGHV